MSQEATRPRSTAVVQRALSISFPHVPLDWKLIAEVAVGALDDEGLLCSQSGLRKDIADALRIDAEGRAPGGEGTPEQVAAVAALNDAASFIEAGF